MNQNRNNPIAGMLGQLLRQNPQMQSNPLAQNMISVIQNGDDAKGVDSADTEESGKVIDMIKDLAQAQKYCWEACYYKTLIKAMEDADYQRMGYTQTPKQQAFMKDWLRDPEEFENRMRDKDHGEWPLSRRGEFRHEEGQYGRPYGEYLEARKHYTESHSAMDKADMDKYAGEHLMSAMTAIRTIYGDADPELRKKIKADFSKLVADMPT